MRICLHFILILSMLACIPESSIEYPSSQSIYFPEPFDTNKLDSMQLWVTEIKDGDSFVAIDSNNIEHSVRMLYIDAPEKFQPYSIISRQFSADLLFQDSIKIYFNAKDKYDRILGIVVNSNGKVVNEELLKNGLAWHFKRYSEDPKYSKWQDSAIQHQIGLFSESNPTPPWNWRKNN